MPGRIEDPRNGGLEAGMGVGDHQLQACSPRRTWSLRRNSVQKVSASEGPTHKPMISRRPSVSTAMAIMAATDTILSPWRTLR